MYQLMVDEFKHHQGRGKHGNGPSTSAKNSHINMLKSLSTSRSLPIGAPHHSHSLISSVRLSEILRHEAMLLEHIVTDQRYYPDYYRVTFYGNFPGAIRDKRFIVSDDLSDTISFIERLSSIVVTSGKSLGHFANACSINTLALSF